MDANEAFEMICQTRNIPTQTMRIVPQMGQPKQPESYYNHNGKVVLISGHFATVASPSEKLTFWTNQQSARLTAPIKTSPGVDYSKVKRCGGGIY